MDPRDLRMDLLRTAMMLIVLSCTAAVTPLLAQQAQSATPVSVPSATLSGPRLSPEFQRFEPRLARDDAPGSSSSIAAAENHTIVVSTLALVLIAVIIVLLI